MTELYESSVVGLTFRQARLLAEKELKEGGVPDADIDAQLLLEYASSLGRGQLFLKENEQIPQAVLAIYREAVSRRKRRIPLQQIVGTACFMGMDFIVSEHVLTPRQDTEVLAEQAIDHIRRIQKGRGASGERVRVLDVCTGSGCLIVSAARFCPGIEAVGTDISRDALDIARRNVQNSGTDVSLLCGDLFEKVSGGFDLIMSNPPYVRSDDIPKLMEEVRDHEPRLALDGGQDGLSFYRRIIEKAPLYLKEGGCLLFEIGADQGRDVRHLLKAHGFGDMSVIKDYSGLDRVAFGRFGGAGGSDQSGSDQSGMD